MLEYSLIAMANSRGSEAMLNRVMTKDNIGLVAVLELIDDNQIETDDVVMAAVAEREIITEDKEKQNSTKSSSILLDNNTISNADVAALLRSAARKEQQCELLSLTDNRTNYHHHESPPKSVEKAKKKRRQIVVCNTHIHWDPECCDVKLVQTILLMNELESIAKHHGIKLRQEEKQHELPDELFNNQTKQSTITTTAATETTTTTSGDKLQQMHDDDDMLPLILLGDFNSLPDSGVTEFLIDGHINSLHEDFRDHKYSSCSNSVAIPNVVNTTAGSAESMSTVLNYNHPFNLASAYKKDIMPYTNYTPQFKAIIDYIFYSQNSIQLLGVLGALDKNWFKGNRIKGLPHVNFPSDHLPLLAKFKLPPSSPTTTKINDELSRC